MKPILLIVVALGCGLVAAVGIFQKMDNHSSAASQRQMLKVVVASKEININEAFTEQNVELVDWPADQNLQGALSDVAALEGKYARVRLYPGEPVLDGKTMGINDASSSLRVPLGYRVVSVKVSLDSSVSNLIEPGDRVDVIAVLREGRENPMALAKTILKAVRVFAVNSEIVRSLDVEKSPDEARTVSLLLKPDQAEKVMMAAELGTIKLSMRSPEDAQLDDTRGCTVEEVLGRPGVADSVTPSGQLDLDRFAHASVGSNRGPSYWSMDVGSPGTARRYTWDAPGAAPNMVVLYSSDGSAKNGNSGGAGANDSAEPELDDDVEVKDYSNGIE